MQRSLTRLCLSAALGFLPAAAYAEERDFCANRPGLGTPACTLAPGRAMMEVGIGAWDHSSDAGSVEDDAGISSGAPDNSLAMGLAWQFR